MPNNETKGKLKKKKKKRKEKKRKEKKRKEKKSKRRDRKTRQQKKGQTRIDFGDRREKGEVPDKGKKNTENVWREMETCQNMWKIKRNERNSKMENTRKWKIKKLKLKEAKVDQKRKKKHRKWKIVKKTALRHDRRLRVRHNPC